MKAIMPVVVGCQTAKCAYNRDHVCHARAITIGHGTHPCCDTFFQSSKHATAAPKAGVGACKVSSCAHNQDFECQAKAIQLERGECPAVCMTYAKR